MDLGLQGRVAAVAAASGGIGRAIALGLLQEGARVAICSRDESRIRATAAELEAVADTEVLAMAADVSRAEDARRFVRETASHWGRLDVLVANAGGPPPGGFDDLDDDQWQRAFELNLMSTVRMTREALPHMRAGRWGRIINITSISVKAPIQGLLLSNALRTGVVGMAKTLSVEVASEGITVNNICPGRIDTDRIRSLDASRASTSGRSVDDVRQEAEAQIPMRRSGSPEELASLAVFLASERASYITGTTIQVDGGSLSSLL